MNVIWWFDSICIVITSALSRQMKEKKREREFGQKKRRWKESDVESLVFLVRHECTHVWSMKNRWVWIRREWMWKSGRQGKKSGWKRGGKREKGKSGFGKSPFCFCLTVCLPLPFFPCTHHTTMPQHTLSLNSPHHTTWRIGAHHHMQTGPCAVLPFLGVDSKTHCIIHTPLHHLTSRNTHQPTQHRHSSWCMQQWDNNCQWEWGLDKGQKWDNTAAPTHWLKWQQHNGFETHWTVADHWGMGWCGWHWQWQSVWHQAITLTSTPSNHQTPTLSSLFTLKLKPPAFCPFHNTLHPLLLHIVSHATLPQPHITWLLKKKERRWFEGSWKKRSGTFEWLFLKSHKTTQHFSTIIHT